MQVKNYCGSDILVKTLLDEKVECVFGYPGGAIMPVYDALHRYSDRLCHILMRHEQGAIHAAQGYARVGARVGVCISTSGPGATNLITGLADALADSTPIVCITGQVASYLLGTDAFQETNIIDISLPVTKWNAQVTQARDISSVVRKAFYIAQSGRPGPVLIDITKDAQFQEAQFDDPIGRGIPYFHAYPKLEQDKIETAALLINSAKKPFVLVGQGVVLAKAEEEFKAFVEKSGIPVASTLLGLDVMESTHPLFVGMLGMHGGYAPNVLTNQCDLLIAVGMRFDDRVTGDLNRYARQAKVIHLDIEDSEIGKNVPCDVPVLGNCKESLVALTQQIDKGAHKEWLDRFRVMQQQEKKIIQKDLNPKKENLTMGEVIKWVNRYKDKTAVLVTDVGQHQMVASRYFNFSSRKSQVTSGGLGTMGFALPAAIGAQFAAPNRQIICIAGDGGIQMTLQELGVILQNKLPIKIILLNNNFLGMVRQWQELFFKKRYAFTELINPDFIQLVKAYDIQGKKVHQRADLEESIKEMFASDKSYFLEVVVEKQDNVFPMLPTGAAVDEVRLD